MLTRKCAFVCLMVIAIAGIGAPALAFDAGTFLRELEDSARENGNSFNYGALEDAADGSFTLKSVEIANTEDNYTITIESLSFDNGSYIGPDGLEFDGMDAVNFRQEGTEKDGEKYVVTAAQMSAEDFSLPNLGDMDNPLWPADVGRLELVDVTINSVEDDGKTTIHTPGLVLEDLEATTGNNFLLGSFSMEPATGKVLQAEENLDIGFEGLRLSGVEHFGKTGLEVSEFDLGSLQVKGKDEKGEDLDIRFGGMSIDNLYVADPTVTNRPLLSDKAMSMDISGMDARYNGKSFFGWEGGYGTYTYEPESKTGVGDGKISNIFIDFSAAPMEPHERKNLEQLKALGYEKLAMNIEGIGSWSLDSGRLNMDRYRFEFVDAGAIELNMQIDGYTEDVARNFSKIANDVNLETDPEKKEFKSMQMLAALTSLSINGLQISVEDASLLNKVLAFQAQKMQQEPQQLAQMVGPMASIMLAPYNIPEFAASISAALSKFMQGNKTITVAAKPNNGLVITEIISLASAVQAGQVSPADIIERLNLTVTAR